MFRLSEVAGLRAAWICDGSRTCVSEHAHDWPVLSLFVAGSYTNRTEAETLVLGPSAVLYRPGDAHANTAGDTGHDQVEIEFDPVRLGLSQSDLDRPRHWLDGPPVAASRKLAEAWLDGIRSPAELARATGDYLRAAVAQPPSCSAPWVSEVVRAVQRTPSTSAEALAKQVGVTVAWLAASYLKASGERLSETVLRRRVEVARLMLERTSAPPAEIAVASGFYDQSHMSRTFRKVLRRTPGAFRTSLGLPRGDLETLDDLICALAEDAVQD